MMTLSWDGTDMFVWSFVSTWRDKFMALRTSAAFVLDRRHKETYLNICIF